MQHQVSTAMFSPNNKKTDVIIKARVPQKDVAEQLRARESICKRAITTKNGNAKQEDFKAFEHPKAELRENRTSHGREICASKNCGRTNGCNHLKVRLRNCDEEELLKCYFRTLEAKSTSIFSFFKPSSPTSRKEKEAIDWSSLMIDKGSPAGVTEEKSHKNFKSLTAALAKKTYSMSCLA